MEPSPSRWILGICPHADAAALVGTAVELAGSGWQMVALGHQSAIEPSDDLASDADDIGSSTASDPSARWTELAGQLTNQLLNQLGPDRESAVAVVLHDVGQWSDEAELGRRYRSWCDPFHLAAHTGLNVIDQLPCSDLAAGGTGGPVELFGLWALLRDARSSTGHTVRALIDVAPHAVDIWLLPGTPPRRTPVLGHTTLRNASCDESQCLMATSIDHGSANTEGWIVVPSWSPKQARPCAKSPRDYGAAGENIDERHGNVDQILADLVLHALRDELPTQVPVREVIVAPSSAAPAWAQALSARDNQLEVSSLADYGWQCRATLQAAAIAVTGAMSIDRMAANPRELLGIGPPRILGQFTPGSGAKWHQLLSLMSVGSDPVVPLRMAS